MAQNYRKLTYRLMLLILVLMLMPSLTVLAEGPAAATGSAPAVIGGSGSIIAVSGPAPVAIGATAPVASGMPAFSPLTGPTTATQSGLPAVIGERGASPLSLGEIAQQPVLGKEGVPTATKDGKLTIDTSVQAASGDTTEMSDVERSIFANEDTGAMRPQPFRVGKITQFGYSFFKKSNAFAPVVDVPVGTDYIIGPGDVLVINSSGSLDGTFHLEVNRSGEVLLPKVGALRVWGTTFGKVPELIKASLSQAFRTVQVNVTMGKLRLIKVYLVGEVVSPGDYDVSSLSTVINVLAAAGGPSKSGTLRGIQVLRAGKVTETVDLYDFFLKGDKSRDIRLQPGDTINVPIHGDLVGIGGSVRKPGIYEFLKETSLKELLDLAGGVPPSSYLLRIQLSRVIANDKKLIEDFNFDPKLSSREFEAKTSGIKLRDMDLVKIMPIDFTVRDQVRLDGYVLRPGHYALKPGMRVKDLIGADNLLPESYSGTVEITRLIPPDFHPERINVNLDRIMQGIDRDNISLTEFDSVRIFSRWEMDEMPRVRIGGEVQKPGEYRLFEKMSLRDLIFAAGNVKKTAYLKSTEITRIEITRDQVKSRIININLDEALKENPQDNIVLENYDEIVVRRLPDWKEETDRYFTIRGEVRFPGVYPIQMGERLSSLIQRAGGYTDKGYLKGAKFTRRTVRELQQKRMDEVITRTELDLTRKQQELASVAASKEELEGTRTALNGMKASLDKLKTAKAEGRISIHLATIGELTGSPYDLILQGGDSLEIPQSTNSIQVFGEVYNPTTVIHIPGEELGFYLKKAGGTTNNGEETEMYVIRTDGTVVSRREINSFFYDNFSRLQLDPGDTVVVPQVIEKVAWMRNLKDIAFILGQTALTAGVLIAAGL
jgi:polysaccharide biosynthesis/export protein